MAESIRRAGESRAPSWTGYKHGRMNSATLAVVLGEGRAMSEEDFMRGLPKAELSVHIEGTWEPAGHR
jgi:hypothetical protein